MCGTEFDIAVVQSAVTASPPLFTSDEVFAALAGWTAGGVVEAVPRSMTRYRFRDPGQAAALADGIEPAGRADAHHGLGDRTFPMSIAAELPCPGLRRRIGEDDGE